ncbi:MAG: hypothetical protein QME55_14300 [Brevundimonas sp.]|uniref:hypothetical protein n=1 Tax=Brevundimonas sp. TaxID=1871086 RepID=UPI00262211B6|nr:hypothetical protein [Brevundimonas sp.]MDI6625899.1 hypothetical protein [Brevundimonas sp.]
MNLADLHDEAALASVSSDLLDQAAEAGVNAMATVLAEAMGWTSGDFLPCQTDALEHGARIIAGALARMAEQNGLLPEEPAAVADPLPIDPAVLFNCCTDGAQPDWRDFTVLQIGGCRMDPDGDGAVDGGQDRANTEFYTVYGINADGEALAITDLPDANLDQAKAVADTLSGLSGLSVELHCALTQEITQ